MEVRKPHISTQSQLAESIPNLYIDNRFPDSEVWRQLRSQN